MQFYVISCPVIWCYIILLCKRSLGLKSACSLPSKEFYWCRSLSIKDSHTVEAFHRVVAALVLQLPILISLNVIHEMNTLCVNFLQKRGKSKKKKQAMFCSPLSQVIWKTKWLGIWCNFYFQWHSPYASLDGSIYPQPSALSLCWTDHCPK